MCFTLSHINLMFLGIHLLRQVVYTGVAQIMEQFSHNGERTVTHCFSSSAVGCRVVGRLNLLPV